MHIVSATLHRVRLPLVHAFQTSSHRKNHLEHIIVQLTDANGVVGWGEIASPSDPYYCPDTADTSWLITGRNLLPPLLDKEFETPADVNLTWSKVRGHQFAKAGVDMAAWTLHSALTGHSLTDLLGGTRSEVVAGVSLGIEPTLDDLVTQVGQHVDNGYPRVKLKIAPGWDVDPVRVVRAEFGDLDLHVDANGAYTESEEHLTALRGLGPYGLTMIEQPFAPNNWLASRRLSAELDTPICLDESVEDLDDLATMIDLKAGRILNIKVSRMGGLTPALVAHEVAQQYEVPVWCGGMHEFGIGRAANVAISSLAGFSLPSDVSSWDKYYARDIVIDGVTADHGRVTVPTASGVGFEVDTDFLAENTVDTLTLTV
ncbi:MAG: o-succinylbenzoate synthase [Propionibacteriales bacterium]|nr:o-succinylbenzoate synthase [Propionibacteriales bacterium]